MLREMTTEESLEFFRKENEELKSEITRLKGMSGKTRVQWEAKRSDSGIEIVGGPSTITKTGTIVGASALPVGPGQMGILFVVAADDGTWALLDPGTAKVIP